MRLRVWLALAAGSVVVGLLGGGALGVRDGMREDQRLEIVGQYVPGSVAR